MTTPTATVTTDALTIAADALTDAKRHLDTALDALRDAGMPEATRTKVAALACNTHTTTRQVLAALNHPTTHHTYGS